MTTPVRPTDVAAPTAAPPPIGHNQPPPYDADEFASLFNGVSAFAAAAGEWLDLKEITTEEQATYLSDFITGCQKKAKEVEAWRVKAKKPHDDAGKAVQKAAELPAMTLDEAVKKSKALLAPWIEKKRLAAEAEKRRLAEEAEQKRLEAERLAREAAARNDVLGGAQAELAAKEAEKAAKEAARVDTRGAVKSASGAGRTISTVTVKNAVLTDLRRAVFHYSRAPELRETLERLATAECRAKGFTGEIPGFEIKTTEQIR